MGQRKIHRAEEGLYKTRRYTNPAKVKKTARDIGFQFFYSLLTVCILGFCVKESASSFMFSSILYSVSLLKEYMDSSAQRRLRKYIRNMQILLLGLIFAIAVLYLFNVLVGISIEGSLYIRINPDWAVSFEKRLHLKYLWIVQGVTALLTGVDWFVLCAVAEKETCRRDRNPWE